jgi:hypothetical protein
MEKNKFLFYFKKNNKYYLFSKFNLLKLNEILPNQNFVKIIYIHDYKQENLSGK